ncbi:hypothetical protein PDIG_35920 [Penicillium digitatum PHI26]|uniref:Uncharacterized protein n=2 Tax=Penicillium digitatum TaxID=36651 RepID=K9FYX8_PEND2|nr:hypothetical protein PDIP_05560 [Penicillium digitatum Pd1]EKV13807.1 hypothetical protein PDIG_35920 [Penicillium digitatum PHI26]EKV21540.1 hypothetical protein PDIP_05560 [Penicillium digitatum Pd1]
MQREDTNAVREHRKESEAKKQSHKDKFVYHLIAGYVQFFFWK